MNIWRHLTSELTQEWSKIEETEAEAQLASDASAVVQVKDSEVIMEPQIDISKEELLELVKEMVQFYMSHNAEAEACDLLMEIEHVELVTNFVEKETYQRVCLYLLRWGEKLIGLM